MVNPVSPQPTPASRPQDDEPKSEAPRTEPSQPANSEPPASTDGGPQPTPGGARMGAPGAGGGAFDNPAVDRFEDNGSATNIGA